MTHPRMENKAIYVNEAGEADLLAHMGKEGWIVSFVIIIEPLDSRNEDRGIRRIYFTRAADCGCADCQEKHNGS